MERAMSSQRAKVIDGRALGAMVKDSVRDRAKRLADSGRPARLDAVLIEGNDSAEVYARNQATTCRELGIDYRLQVLPRSSRYEDIAGRVLLMNGDPLVHAIMLHLPLPADVDAEAIQSLIAVSKDVEGVNPANIGNVVYGRRSLVPCTALATMELIESTGLTLRGTRVVVVGASNIVGKPIAVLLMRAEATVISTNKFTPDLPSFTRQGDVLIAAAGVPRLIKREMVKPGAIVIDVGVNRIPGDDGKMLTVGDVDFEGVSEVASAITPVPGGVGPMTVAMMMRNAIDAAEHAPGRTSLG